MQTQNVVEAYQPQDFSNSTVATLVKKTEWFDTVLTKPFMGKKAGGIGIFVIGIAALLILAVITNFGGFAGAFVAKLGGGLAGIILNVIRAVLVGFVILCIIFAPLRNYLLLRLRTTCERLTGEYIKNNNETIAKVCIDGYEAQIALHQKVGFQLQETIESIILDRKAEEKEVGKIRQQINAYDNMPTMTEDDKVAYAALVGRLPAQEALVTDYNETIEPLQQYAVGYDEIIKHLKTEQNKEIFNLQMAMKKSKLSKLVLNLNETCLSALNKNSSTDKLSNQVQNNAEESWRKAMASTRTLMAQIQPTLSAARSGQKIAIATALENLNQWKKENNLKETTITAAEIVEAGTNSTVFPWDTQKEK